MFCVPLVDREEEIMTRVLTLRPNATTTVNNVETGGIFDVTEDGREVGRIWVETAVDIDEPEWKFRQVKDGVCIGETSGHFRSKELALDAFEKKFYEQPSAA
jgi:hypothetical protein